MNTDMRKFESLQRDESRAQSADSSKAYRKCRAFYCSFVMVFFRDQLIWLLWSWY